MKNIKTILLVALMSVASYGGYTAYEAATMTEAERALMENVEALTQYEDNRGGYNVMHIPCFTEEGYNSGECSATSYSGGIGNQPYHSHSCSSCCSN